MDASDKLPVARAMNEVAVKEVVINARVCRRCNNQFVPNSNCKQSTAQYYRCSQCLTSKAIAEDIIYSCVIC